jgi:putative phosphoesterase
MQVAILSDIHDNLWNLAAALQFIEGRAAVMLCCGDLCSPFVIDQLARFPGETHIVFGNNDADLFRITAKAAAHPRLHLHGEFYSATLGSRRVAMNHFDYLARPIALSGQYDLVCFGHNHELELTQERDCLLLNPGTIMGAKFTTGKWQDTEPTFAIYDTSSHRAQIYTIDLKTRSVETRS